MGPRNAHRAKDVLPMEQLNIDIKPRRCDSFVFQQKDFDVTNLVNYMEKKKKEGVHITYFHAFVQTTGKTSGLILYLIKWLHMPAVFY